MTPAWAHAAPSAWARCRETSRWKSNACSRCDRVGSRTRMRNYIFGSLGVLLGGAACLGSLLRERPAGGTYGAGQVLGTILGVLMLIAGAYTLINAIREGGSTRPKKRKVRRDHDD